MDESKKQSVEHSEDLESPKLHAQHGGLEGGAPFTTEQRMAIEKKLRRKLDMRFSILPIIYVLNYIDRNNASAARLKGFEKDLGLQGQQFATVLSILYVGYILFQIPSNMIINKIARPSWYIAICMLLWGFLSVITGEAKTFSHVIVIRFFLGCIEAAFLPGALFLLSRWYTRKEIALRYTILYAGNLMSNAFGSLLAAGILNNLNGTLGHAGWRWLFYIEGALTMFVALIAGVMLPDRLDNSRWFTQDELLVAKLRMAEDAGGVDQDSSNESMFHGFKLAFRDARVYVLAISLTAVVGGLSFNAYFPTLTGTLGFSTYKTLCMSAPPWIFATLVALVNSWHSDRTQEKFWHTAWPLMMGIVGFIIACASMNTAARYVSLFLQAGSYAGYVIMYSSFATSFPRPPAKRAVAIAFLNAFSQLGNIYGSYIWDKKYGPSYRVPYIVVICLFVVGILTAFAFRMQNAALNKRLDAGERAWQEQADVTHETARIEGLNDEEAANMKSGFRYYL